MTAFVVGAGWEFPLLIVPFIWLSCCGPPPPPPGAPAGFTEPLSCPFWLGKPRITGFSVLAVLMLTWLNFIPTAMKPLTVSRWSESTQNVKIALAFLNLNQLKVNTKSFTRQQCLLWYQVSRNKFLFSFFIRLLCMEIKLGLSIDKFCQHYLEYSKRASQAFKHWPTVQLAILIS